MLMSSISSPTDTLAGKSQPPDEITQIKIGNYVIDVSRAAYRDPNKLPLSGRELDALYWSSLGLTGSEIARKMNVSRHTVDTYKRRIFEKLGVKTIAQASAIALAVACGGNVTKAS